MRPGVAHVESTPNHDQQQCYTGARQSRARTWQVFMPLVVQKGERGAVRNVASFQDMVDQLWLPAQNA
ncbi:MAG: hypothetical protein NVSMB42_22630 [Herpetosiphon sp.]